MKLVAGIIIVAVGYTFISMADTQIAIGLALALLGLNFVVRSKK